MLQEILNLINTGKVHSTQELAKTLDISEEMATKMIHELVKRKYLKEVNGNCNSSREVCLYCPTNTRCQSAYKKWMFTRKGETISKNFPHS